MESLLHPRTFLCLLVLSSVPGLAHAGDPEIDAIVASESARGIRSLGLIEPRDTEHAHRLEFQAAPAEGLAMNPREAIYLWVPPAFREKAVEFITLAHRQDVSTRPSDNSFDYTRWDPSPAYASVQVYDASWPEGQRWRYWLGPASSQYGAKFAETRSAGDPEIEGLYEWNRYGHGAVGGTGPGSVAPLKPLLLRVVASGSDTLFFHRLAVKLSSGETPDLFLSHIFTPGTMLGEFTTAVGRRYGGGEHHGGVYPEALVLDPHSSGNAIADLGDGFIARGNELRIRLPAGKKLIAADVACGDARGWDSEHGTYYRGGATLTVRLIRAGGETVSLLESENVGPEGVLRAASPTDTLVTREGDEIQVLNDGISALSIMGARVALKEGTLP